jgi:hypothetical protein
VVHGYLINVAERLLTGYDVLNGIDHRRGSSRCWLQVNGMRLEYSIDDKLIPGHPYWWWQIEKHGIPLHFGKATMASLYKSTIYDAVSLLRSEL